MNRLLFTMLIAGCATRVENVGNTTDDPESHPPTTETHAVRWALDIGDLANDSAAGVAFDPAGDVVAIVATQTPILLDDGTLANSGYGSLITKRAGSDGSERWTRSLAGATTEDMVDLHAVAVDREGNVIVAGMYVGAFQLGTLELTTFDHHEDVFVAKYTSSGDFVWGQYLDRSSDAEALALAVDSSGNVFVAGNYRGNFTFLGEGHDANDSDAYVVSYGPDGTQRWAQVILAPGEQTYVGIAATPDDHVVAAGTFEGAARFGGHLLTASANQAGVLVAFAADGTSPWATVVGSTDENARTWADSVAVTSTGDILVESQDFEDFTQFLTPSQTSVRAFDGDGQAIWSQAIPTAQQDYPGWRTMSVFADDRVASTQWIDAPYSADHPETVTGSLELVRISAGGALQAIEHAGQRMIGAPVGAATRATANGPVGETAVAGHFGGTIDFGVTILTTAAVAPTATNYDALIFVVEP